MTEDHLYEGVTIGRNRCLSCTLDPVVKSDIDFSSSRQSTESSHCEPNDDAVLSPDEADQRDALAARKANELAAELRQDYKIPLLWEDHDCLMLENFEFEYMTHQKGYMYQDVDFESLWDQDKTASFSGRWHCSFWPQLGGLFPLRENP